ncbi:ATP-binding protein [Candidatus Oscillochloris fontis]|uniref:ATP-binding protein n=1 Tax=Candidatus Oscillochloris fontis TaxID=2496868 RepID=UPI00101D7037|nr:ATP-binding protein [Candidatus Oscillochloris fontis]
MSNISPTNVGPFDADPLLVWRQQIVALLLRLFFVLIIPMMLINMMVSIWIGYWIFGLCQVSMTLIVFTVVLARRTNYRLRGMVLVGYFLLLTLIGLYFFGLFGMVPGLLVVTAVLTVLLLGQRAAYVVIGIGLVGFLVIPASIRLGIRPYPFDPIRHVVLTWPLIFNNLVLIGGTSILMVIIVGSLLRAYQTSLETTRSALHQLEQTNVQLQASLSTNNELNQLNAAMRSRQAAEEALSEQLRYAEALARCSRILLVQGADALAWQPVVQQAVTTLYSALNCSHLALHIFPRPDAAVEQVGIVIEGHAPATVPVRQFRIHREHLPPILLATIEQGVIVVGPIDQLFAPGTRAHTLLSSNGIRSMLGLGLQIDPHWQGALAAGDGQADRIWNDAILRMLRTGLEMIKAFIQQWEMANTLRTRNDAAEAATRAKSAFLANMSHEIRTPLNAVLGMSAMLQESDLNHEQRIFVDTIRTGGEALLAVISDILDFSRIESGQLELELAVFDLHHHLKTTIDLVAHTIQTKNLAINCYIAPDVPQTVQGDAARLRQILLNLLGNAVKFTSQGEVALEVTRLDQPSPECSQISFQVRDTGIGMTEEQLERIFAPFVQADSSTARRYGGTGLGLAISQQLAHLMGGTIGATSRFGHGSIFSVNLPFAHANPVDLPRPNKPLCAAEHPLDILVAEDNLVNQEVVRRMVTRLGHHVTIVDDGQAAVDALHEHAYDVVLMDIQMPRLDGAQAILAIRAYGDSIVQPRIIALTANALDSERERLLNMGADGYLSKPVQPNDLQQALACQNPAADDPMPPTAEPTLIDWNHLELLAQSLDLDGAATDFNLAQLFEEALLPQLDALDAAIVHTDWDAARRIAHRLRGGSLQLGAHALATLCNQLEQTSSLQDAHDLAEQLRPCYQATAVMLYQRFPR